MIKHQILFSQPLQQLGRQRLGARRVRKRAGKNKLPRRIADRLEVRRDERRADQGDNAVRLLQRQRHQEIFRRLLPVKNRVATARRPVPARPPRPRKRRGGEGLIRNLRQRPHQRLVRRGQDFIRQRPRLRLEPRRKPAHGGETDERRMQRCRRQPPWLQIQRKIFGKEKFAIEAEIIIRRGQGELRLRQTQLFQLRIPRNLRGAASSHPTKARRCRRRKFSAPVRPPVFPRRCWIKTTSRPPA